MESPTRLVSTTSSCQILLTSVCMDLASQGRMKIHPQIVREYAQAMRRQCEEGEIRFPPVVLFFDGKNYWIGDGFHRVLAAKDAGLEEILAEARTGNQRDALLHSLSANSTHGLPRTNADKRKAVSLLLADAEWSGWSDREIARRCQVDNRFVGNMRRRLSVDGPQMRERKVRRGETVYEMAAAKHQPALQHSPKAEDEIPAAEAPSGSEPAVQRPGQACKPPSTDAVGVLCDETTAAAFTIRSDFERAKNLYAQLADLLDRIARRPGGEALARQLIREEQSDAFNCTDLQASLRKVIEAEPYSPRCPYCYLAHPGWNHPDCKACSGRGWLTRTAFESCPESYRAQLLARLVNS